MKKPCSRSLGMRRVIILSLLLLWCLHGVLPCGAQLRSDYDLPPVSYSNAEDDNTITRLQAAIDEQRASLPGSNPAEILKALLDELKIPVTSQVLVFSKTSLQRDLISAINPRAIYFNQDFYVGYVPGGLIEVIACDDSQGIMFYSFDPNMPADKRKFIRSAECLTCHANANTMDVPGLLVRSVHTEKNGQPFFAWGSFLTTDASPIEERWGGWYVTGNHGNSRHMGNKWVIIPEGAEPIYDKERGHNVKDLTNYFDTDKHLTNTSDILALMILEHQVKMQNIFSSARMGYARRVYLSKAINGGKFNASSPAGIKMAQGYVDSILKALMFSDEVELPLDGIDGGKDFSESFLAQGVYHDGHSLRDLRLQKRLFKYRCSFMIYSRSFDMLPEEIRKRTLTQLHELVTGQSEVAWLPVLSDREKQRIHSVLSHTHPAYQKIGAEHGGSIK